MVPIRVTLRPWSFLGTRAEALGPPRVARRLPVRLGPLRDPRRRPELSRVDRILRQPAHLGVAPLPGSPPSRETPPGGVAHDGGGLRLVSRLLPRFSGSVDGDVGSLHARLHTRRSAAAAAASCWPPCFPITLSRWAQATPFYELHFSVGGDLGGRVTPILAMYIINSGRMQLCKYNGLHIQSRAP